MSDYSEFFLDSASNIARLELLEISHPNFTQTYYIVRNATTGLTVALEDLSSVDFVYYPLQITRIGARENLDFGLRVDLGDLGEILPNELDAVASAGGFETKPVVKYRTYRGDDLTAPLEGPFVLEVVSFSFTRQGSSFEAKAPSLNVSETGELYTIDRFPMLRGSL